MFGKYNILKTPEELFKLDDYLTNQKPDYIAVDTETNGLHFFKHVVIGFSLSINNHSGFYIPLLEWQPTGETKKKKVKKKEYLIQETGHFKCVWTHKTYPEDVTPQQYQPIDLLKDCVKKWFSGKKLIMHNAPFDVLMIESSFGVNLEEDVFCDTQLLKHVIDENTSSGLKQTALLWHKELNLNVQAEANKEQKEMGESVIKNGGKFTKIEKHIWRGSPELVAKYGVADTFLTYGIFEVGIQKLEQQYTPRHFQWFFEDEVMPLCREVVINMKRQGVRVNVPYFTQLEVETRNKMWELEDTIINSLGSILDGFTIGKSLDEAVSKKALVERIIELEGLDYPVYTKGKNKGKKSLAKPAVKAMYETEPHWLWGYLLGEDEIKYSDKKLLTVIKKLYHEKEGRRYRFNIGSSDHLRWLFCDFYGHERASLPQTDSATKDNPIPSMKAEVLKDHFLKKYDFVKPLLLWKKLQKLFTTYVTPIGELHNNGYLHMDFKQAGTVSGRFACGGGYNLQTLPQVEELEACPKCKSKNVREEKPIALIANLHCNDCGHVEEDILCPSAIKEGFMAPEGCDIVNADYSSLEPRVFAFMSGDPKLKAIYWEHLDMYSKVYCDMSDPKGEYSPDPKAPNFLKKVAKPKRNMVKPVVLGIPYGARPPQVANLMGFKKTYVCKYTGKEKETLDVDKGKEYSDLYLNTYPKLREYMTLMENQAVTRGFVETMVGRRRHFTITMPVFEILIKANRDPDWLLDMSYRKLQTKNFDEYLTEENLYKVLTAANIRKVDEKGVERDWAFVRGVFKNEFNNSKNFPIQGMGAHITNRGMLDTARFLKKEGLDAWVCLQVHDEISCYSKKEHTPRTVDLLKKGMEDNIYAKLLDIDMIAEPLIAQTLKEAK